MASPALRLRFWLAVHAVLELVDSAVTEKAARAVKEAQHGR